MLTITDLRKNYGDRPVLRGLNLQLQPGEVYGLLGPNGAGKTTTINILCNLLQADGGGITLGDRPLLKAPRRWLGVAPQENLLYRSLTCGENLRFFAQLYGLSPKQQDRQIAQTLTAVGLGDRRHTVVEALSGGMQRRLNMAIALVHQPQLLILDEPTTGLDIETRYEIWELIRTLRDQGLTILLTTHLLDEAQRLCQRIGILQGGRIVAEGCLETLRRRIPARELVTIHTADVAGAIACGNRAGLTHRYYGGDLVFWLPELWDLPQIIDLFSGVTLDAVARQPVQLEHIYLEITQNQPEAVAV